ncbi:MAG: hypothetical protein QOE70_4878 [Chthoniobacter sp.]|nr:hypothetical protein [Chthoniobacter sp.]
MRFHVLQCAESAWGNVRGVEWEPFPKAAGHGKIGKPGAISVELQNPQATELYDLEPTNEPSIFLFSERVAKFVANAGFRGIDFFPVHLLWGGQLFEDGIVPVYYWGRIWGRIAGHVFLNGRMMQTDPTGNVVLAPPATISGRIKLWHLDINRWDGSDFCRMIPFGPGTTLCSERVADSAVANNWTNFSLNHTTYGDLRLDL